MTEKILIVDDDPNVLKSYQRRLRKEFDVETALCSEEGLTAINFLGPFAVVVSDMNMPRENGADFLHRLLKLAPDSIRIMLTGNADQQTAADAINHGRVFRFLTKPCDGQELAAALHDGIEEYHRRTEQRRVLSETVVGAVDMLAKVLSVVNPAAFGKATRANALVTSLAKELGLADQWEVEAAALLSPVGLVSVPATAFDKMTRGDKLTAAEQRAFDNHPVCGSELISQVPRLDGVAKIVQHQHSPGADAPLGAAILSLVLDFDDALTAEGHEPNWSAALERLEASNKRYDPDCWKALERLVKQQDDRHVAYVHICELLDDMQLIDDVESVEGALLVPRGRRIDQSLRLQLTKFAGTHEIKEPIRVLTTQADKVASA